jgi:hypothetical protein
MKLGTWVELSRGETVRRFFQEWGPPPEACTWAEMGFEGSEPVQFSISGTKPENHMEGLARPSSDTLVIHYSPVPGLRLALERDPDNARTKVFTLTP